MIRFCLIIFLLFCNNCAIMNSWGFKFYWNAPTFMCHQYGINFIEVTRDYGIIQNNNDSFRGNKIAILYDPGMFPALINNSSGKKL